MFKLTGSVKIIKDTVQVTEKFAKREFVITDASSMYPQDIMFQAVQDKCSMLDGFNEQDQVEVSFNLRGREWTSPQGEVKYFNTLDAWRLTRPAPGTNGDASNAQDLPVYDLADIAAEEKDDLPF